MTRDIFVATDWLADHLSDPNVAVVDGSWYLPTQNRDGKAEYLRAHIPGAVHFDIDSIKDTTSALPHMLPTPKDFASAVGAMGISEDMTIIVYDGAGLFAAARVRWTFEVMGARDVRILEGGFPKWTAEKRPFEAGVPRRTPKVFKTRFKKSAVAGLDDIKAALKDKSVSVVDARPAARFDGTAPEPRPGIPSGHMPGSFSLPFDRIVKEGKLVEPAEVRKAFAAAGVDVEKPVVTTCGSGVSAALLSLALETAGKKPKALYDGSWAEWASTKGCAVAPKPKKD
jgi:thiosulfate/3-mercaptopyruvate sulfurtransferase